MRAIKFIVTFALSVGVAEKGFSQTRDLPDSQEQLEAVVQSCIQAKKRDQICDYLIILQQVGTDAIELVKEYAHLGPRAYTLLTLANYAATGRLRFRGPSYFDKNRGSMIYDIQRDQTMVYYERTF